ncbi:uncharacterized protein LOC125779407 [Bactrocera dorsalis]|uniref:Uncharacterized protein LOC125779407 n=1 Tax=Bactrocera dorsalis TaxID=27457 RepID=A0ABM3K5F6_BACDO|nr:uncharacterized protein LOC125779407 [Bactrocera dorsalis]
MELVFCWNIKLDLLWLACRLNILETVLSKVFTFCFGPSSSPDIPLFKRFQAAWPSIHLNNLKPLEKATDKDNLNVNAVNSLLDILMTETQSRDDYMELIELSLLGLGHSLDNVHWRAPGALHRARWMAKLLYAIKIFLFREEDVFETTQREKSQLERFVKFRMLVYVKYWFEAPMAANAPWSDLSLWKDMTTYEAIDPQISEVVKNAIKSHLWYLSDELVGLSLFSDKVTNNANAETVKKIRCEPTDRKVRGDSSLLSDQAELADFANQRSLQVFEKVKINSTFLNTDPNEWNINQHWRETNRKKPESC